MELQHIHWSHWPENNLLSAVYIFLILKYGLCWLSEIQPQINHQYLSGQHSKTKTPIEKYFLHISLSSVSLWIKKIKESGSSAALSCLLPNNLWLIFGMILSTFLGMWSFKSLLKPHLLNLSCYEHSNNQNFTGRAQKMIWRKTKSGPGRGCMGDGWGKVAGWGFSGNLSYIFVSP